MQFSFQQLRWLAGVRARWEVIRLMCVCVCVSCVQVYILFDCRVRMSKPWHDMIIGPVNSACMLACFVVVIVWLMYVYVLSYTELWDVLICLDSATHSLMCLSLCVGGGQLWVRKRINIFNRPVLWKKREKEMDAERERERCLSFFLRVWRGQRVKDLWPLVYMDTAIGLNIGLEWISDWCS